MKRSIETMLFAFATVAATMIIADEARADIDMATINQQGDLELDFFTRAPPGRTFQWVGRASATMVYACPNAPFISENLTNVISSNGYFTADFQGEVHQLLTINLQPGQTNINCPGFVQPALKRVEYRNVSIRFELGTFQYARNVIRNFF